MNTQLVDIIEKYLLSQNIFVNHSALKKYFAAVPSFPSIFALIQTLKQFGIILSATHSDWNTLVKCKEKVLLHLKNKKDIWVILKDCSNEHIVYQDENSNTFRDNKEVFLNNWDGILLYIENIDKEVQSIIRNNNKNIALKKNALYISLLILIGCITFQGVNINGLNIWPISYLALKIIGGFASCSLFRHSLGLTSEFENKACSIFKFTDCKAVLHSFASKFFNKISMSDIGIIYFSSTIILLLFSLLTSKPIEIWTFLAFLSLCSFPYSIFSISYQIFIIKKICPFCLIVVIVLILESILCISFLHKIEIEFNFIIWEICLLTFISFSIILSFIKEYFKKIGHLENIEFDYLKFKRNEYIYTISLQQSVPFKEVSSEVIIVGNSNAPIIATVILGLYCNLCTKTFKRIKRLLISSSADFQFHFHFVSNEIEDTVFILLYSIYKEKGVNVFIDALEEWYTSHDYNNLKQHYPLKVLATKDSMSIYKQQHSLLEKINNVDKTPTIYINNRQLPDLYKIDDLIYFV